MKALRRQLAATGLVTTSLARLYEVGDEVAFRLTVSGEEDALDLWDSLRPLVEATGYWPVILGDSDDLERLTESAGEKRWGSTKTLIEESLAINGEEFLAGEFGAFLSYRQEDLEYARGHGDEERARELDTALAGDDPFRCMPRGKWPRGVRPSDRVVTPYEFDTGEHRPEVFVALVPTKISWQVPIYLQFGAELICVTGDVLELRVADPPTRRAEALALALAREQFLFCRDIVHQGTGTIDHLAAELLNAQTWFFWWD